MVFSIKITVVLPRLHPSSRICARQQSYLHDINITRLSLQLQMQSVHKTFPNPKSPLSISYYSTVNSTSRWEWLIKFNYTKCKLDRALVKVLVSWLKKCRTMIRDICIVIFMWIQGTRKMVKWAGSVCRKSNFDPEQSEAEGRTREPNRKRGIFELYAACKDWKTRPGTVTRQGNGQTGSGWRAELGSCTAAGD